MKKESTIDLFNLLDNKSDFMKKLAKKTGVAFTTIKTSWMYGAIPQRREKEVRSFLMKQPEVKEYYKNQNEPA